MIDDIRISLVNNGLKITPQRLAILEAIIILNNHPTADQILEYIRRNHPNIATGTIYKVLDTLSEKGLIRKVKTDRDVMRYDAVLEKHHHLYCADSDRIEDYYDEELNNILEKYFSRKEIPGLEVKDIRLQISGRFETEKNAKPKD